MSKILPKFKLDSSLIFIPIGLIFLFLIYYFRTFPQLVFQLIVAAAIFYVLTALIHHHKDKSLTPEVIIEYILIAVLIIILLSGYLL